MRECDRLEQRGDKKKRFKRRGDNDALGKRMISGSANRLKRNGSTSSTVSGPPKFKSKTPTRSSSAFRICEFQSPLLAEETRRRRRPRDGETPSLVDVGAPLFAVLKDDFFDAHDFEDDDDDDEAHRAYEHDAKDDFAVVEKSDLIVVATTSTTTTTTTTTTLSRARDAPFPSVCLVRSRPRRRWRRHSLLLM